MTEGILPKLGGIEQETGNIQESTTNGIFERVSGFFGGLAQRFENIGSKKVEKPVVDDVEVVFVEDVGYLRGGVNEQTETVEKSQNIEAVEDNKPAENLNVAINESLINFFNEALAQKMAGFEERKTKRMIKIDQIHNEAYRENALAWEQKIAEGNDNLSQIKEGLIGYEKKLDDVEGVARFINAKIDHVLKMERELSDMLPVIATKTLPALSEQEIAINPEEVKIRELATKVEAATFDGIDGVKFSNGNMVRYGLTKISNWLTNGRPVAYKSSLEGTDYQTVIAMDGENITLSDNTGQLTEHPITDFLKESGNGYIFAGERPVAAPKEIILPTAEIRPPREIQGKYIDMVVKGFNLPGNAKEMIKISDNSIPDTEAQAYENIDYSTGDDQVALGFIRSNMDKLVAANTDKRVLLVPSEMRKYLALPRSINPEIAQKAYDLALATLQNTAGADKDNTFDYFKAGYNLLMHGKDTDFAQNFSKPVESKINSANIINNTEAANRTVLPAAEVVPAVKVVENNQQNNNDIVVEESPEIVAPVVDNTVDDNKVQPVIFNTDTIFKTRKEIDREHAAADPSQRIGSKPANDNPDKFIFDVDDVPDNASANNVVKPIVSSVESSADTSSNLIVDDSNAKINNSTEGNTFSNVLLKNMVNNAVEAGSTVTPINSLKEKPVVPDNTAAEKSLPVQSLQWEEEKTPEAIAREKAEKEIVDFVIDDPDLAAVVDSKLVYSDMHNGKEVASKGFQEAEFFGSKYSEKFMNIFGSALDEAKFDLSKKDSLNFISSTIMKAANSAMSGEGIPRNSEIDDIRFMDKRGQLSGLDSSQKDSEKKDILAKTANLMIINNPDSDFSMISVDTESDYKDDAGRTAPRGSLGYSVLLPKNKIPQLINLLAKKDINLSKVLSDIKGNIDPEANQHNPIVKDINRVRIFTSNVTDFNLHTQSANGMAKDLAQKMKVVMN